MAVIRIQIRRDGITQILRSVRKVLAKGTEAFDAKARNDMKRVFAKHNKSKFDAGQKRGGWKRITVGTLVFSRKDDWVKNQAGNLEQVKSRAGAVGPLEDTGRLKESLINPSNKNFRMRVTKRTITNSTNVAYASKHTLGKTQTYRFGTTHKGRLNERVPRPKGRGRQEKDGRTLRGTKGKGSRPFYRLRTWAERRYPTTAKIPIRSWTGEPNRETVSRIERVVATGVLERQIQRGVRGRPSLGFRRGQ